ncbi:MAG: FAD-binding oxidoreductase, partial [Spirochaetaceae bacterium]
MSANRMDQASVAEEYFRDESRLTGRADSFSFPESEKDVVGIVCEMAETRTPMTIQGARTGITGGAVPDGGHVINCSRMKNILSISRSETDNSFLVEVQAGLCLAEFTEMIQKKAIHFPKHAKI